jgi:hypothetical protein
MLATLYPMALVSNLVTMPLILCPPLVRRGCLDVAPVFLYPLRFRYFVIPYCGRFLSPRLRVEYMGILPTRLVALNQSLVHYRALK